MHKTFCCSFCLLINNTTFYSTELLLWSPYGIGQTIIFALWFLLLLLSFFPRLISAVADWMSAILPQSTHGVALVRISDAGLKRAARGSLEMQDPKMSPKSAIYRHHRTTLSGYIFATKARIDNRKNLLSSNMSSTCPHNMVNFGPLAAEIGLPVWGTPANCNCLRVLAVLLHGSQVVSVSQTLRR